MIRKKQPSDGRGPDVAGTDRPICVHHLFDAQAARRPQAVALIHRNGRMTYEALECAANRLAHLLRDRGVGPDAYVAILMERSPALVVAVLAVLKAGGAYMLLDSAQPAARLCSLVARSGARLALTEGAMPAAALPPAVTVLDLERDRQAIASRSTTCPESGVTPEHLAYVSYTSGSTGEPKGIEVPHRAVVGFMRDASYATFDEAQVTLQHSSVSWDAFTLELWAALTNGGTCVLFPGRVIEPADLQAAIEHDGVTTVWLTASLFASIIDSSPGVLSKLRQLLTGGEAVSPAHVERALALLPQTRLVNGYGPSECTVFSTCFAIPRGVRADHAAVPIGRPVGDRRISLLDDRLEPVPVGVVGEIYIGGPGVARGYLGSPGTTAASFVADPFSAEPGARLYKSGDLATWNADGQLEFVGRTDHQIKLRGFRVELGEIEAVLARHADVRACAVIVRDHRLGDKRLIAYVAASVADLRVDDLRAFLKARLPDYMVPASFVVMERLPLNERGKVDRRALPDPVEPALSEDRAPGPPRTPTEQKVAEICAEVLGLSEVGIQDDFFEIGGHSLLANLVVLKTREMFGVDVPLARFFACPTVAGLASVVEAASVGAPARS